MYIDFMLEAFNNNKNSSAIIWHDKDIKYNELLSLYNKISSQLKGYHLNNKVVALEADFSPVSVAALLCLIELGCIIVPLTKSVEGKKARFKEIAEVEVSVIIDDSDNFTVENYNTLVTNQLLKGLKEIKNPGLILFSSGSTGDSKAALHNIVPMLEKFKVKRHSMRSLTFLLFDHIGGFNTLMYNLSNAGCCIMTSERSPEEICRIIEKYQVETLPTSPTFINLLLLSEAYKNYDLSSLKLVTYGTEAMPESTLLRFHNLFPDIRLLQTYGLSEIGIMRSKSKSSDSLWVKIGGEGFETRVVDGLLEVKAKSAMLGYLNAPSPFTEDGWFKTGDEVLVDGEYMKILGRKSEMINVGGLKVFPAEVESFLLTMDGVEDVAISGEKSDLTGNIVKARFKISTNETVAEFRKRMRQFCKEKKMENYKIPQKVVLVDEMMTGARFKKMRKE
jgi:acyl-coenzyme A synthetase/AMP-(fatty) acid ligase